MNPRLGFLLVLASGMWAQPAAEVRGRVVDAATGEGLERVRVELADTPHRVESGPDGRFQFPPLPPGEYALRVGTVGYHVEKKSFRLDTGAGQEFEVILTPSSLTLGGNEARNLASILAEGPLGRGEKGSWLASARKSYLQYIVSVVSDDPSFAFGFTDMQGHVNYEVKPGHQVSLRVVDGFSGLDRHVEKRVIGLNSFAFSHYRSTLLQAAWRAAPGRRLVATNRLAWLRERFRGDNPNRLPLGGSAHGEWV